MLNEFLDKEAETLPQAARHERNEARRVIEVDTMIETLQRLPAMLRYTCRV